MSMDTKENINWEERRFYTAIHIFSGLAANYHHGLIPANYWVKISVIMADELMKILASPDKGTICPELYQRENQ